MIKIILARHGRTHYNAAGRFQGWLDTELDELGRAQASKLGEFLRAELAGANLRVVSSPLKRAKDTAAAFAQSERAVEIIEDFKEIDHGLWDDKLAAEVDANALNLWRSKPAASLAGEQAESLYDVQARAFKALLALLDDEAHAPHDAIVIFAHDAVIRCLILAAIGASLASFNALQLHNCSASVLEFEPASRHFALVHFNLSAHTGQGLLHKFSQAAL